MQLAPLYPVLHQFLKPLFPSCLWAGDQQLTTIALTFDDGPHPEYTPQLLDVLSRHEVSASFFVLGACVHRAPHIVKAMVEAGHWIGLHGYDHRSFPLLSPTELQQTLNQTQTEITLACSLPPTAVRDVRPPNGLFTQKTIQMLRQWNYRPVMWSVVPEDWVNPSSAIVIHRVMQQVRNGSLIVLHDGSYGGQTVAETVDQLIPRLRQRGYNFVTIEQLWQQILQPPLP